MSITQPSIERATMDLINIMNIR